MSALSLVAVAAALGLLVACILLIRRLQRQTSAVSIVEQRNTDLSSEMEQRLRESEERRDLEIGAAVAEARVLLAEANKRDRDHLDEEQRRNSKRGEELERRAERLERREEDIGRRESKVSDTQQELASREEQLKGQEEQASSRLEELAGLSREDALAQLLAGVEQQSRSVAVKRAVEVEEAVKERSEETAKNIISIAIQRYAGEYVCERTVSVVSLPSDELKGRIIGREGRNIRALEAATGVDRHLCVQSHTARGRPSGSRDIAR